MKVKQLFFALLFFALGLSTLQAQNAETLRLSLSESQQYAVQHNYSLQNASLDVQKAEAAKWQTLSSMLPQVSSSFDYSNMLGYEMSMGGFRIPLNPYGTFAVTASIALSASQIMGTLMNDISVKMSDINQRQSELTTRTGVKSVYTSILVMEEVVSLLDSTLGNMLTLQEATRKSVQDLVFEMFKLAIDKEISPYESADSKYIETVTFSNQKVEKFDDREPEMLQKMEDNEQVKRIAGKKRFGIDENGKPYSKMVAYTYTDAVFEAMAHRFSIDPTMVAFGEENRDWGGAFACYRGLTELIPYKRLFNSPIAEAGIVGAAVGYALCGGRAVAELMYCDFLGRSGDEVFNQLSKWQAMSGGVLKMPVVLRISVGFKYGAQHSQDWSALCNHIPGLKIAYPVTPYDAKGMLNAALAGTDPVIFLESQKLYGKGEMFHKEGVPEGYYEIELGEPDVKKEGKDITLITFGPALYVALDAAKELEEKYGLSAEVIDLRCINPLNYDKLIASVKKTGKCVLVNEAVERGNAMHNIAANLTQFCFDYLDAPMAIVGSHNWVSPAAEHEKEYFPQPSWILDTIHERIMPLKGYVPATNRTLGELQRGAKLGL